MNKDNEYIIAFWACLILSSNAAYANDEMKAWIWLAVAIVMFVLDKVSNRLRRMRQQWMFEKLDQVVKERVARDGE